MNRGLKIHRKQCTLPFNCLYKYLTWRWLTWVETYSLLKHQNLVVLTIIICSSSVLTFGVMFNIARIRTVIICWISYAPFCEKYSRYRRDDKWLRHFVQDIWRGDVTQTRRCTWSVRKVSDLWPGKRNWLTWSVGHLITLKVVPLGLHTLLPAVPPLLEACRKSLFRNGV